MSTINRVNSSYVFHPGEMIKDEIASRGIKQKELASAMGVSSSILNEVINGKRPVSTEYALLLEATLGTPAYIWLRLQEDYNLRTVRESPSFLERLKSVTRLASSVAAL